MAPGGSSGAPVAASALIDTHAHFYDCYEIVPFLEAADANLERAAADLGLADAARPPARALLVMETGGRTLLSRLEGAREQLAEDGWQLEATAETGSLTIRSDGRSRISLVEGRQVVTAERLELLAAPCSTDLASDLPLDETLAAAERAGAVAILPWGFGKWTGRRGRVVLELLESRSRARRLLLGDNGGRLELGSKPRLLTLGAQRGFPLVRGSDPLPIAPDFRRVGSSGSLLRGPFDAARPAAAVRSLLASLRQTPRSFGRGADPISFLHHQLRMQLRRSGR